MMTEAFGHGCCFQSRGEDDGSSNAPSSASSQGATKLELAVFRW